MLGEVKRWGAGLLLGVSLSLTGSAGADPDESARHFPQSTELFLTGKILPSPAVTQSLLSRLEANPAGEWMIEQALSRTVYYEIKDEFLPWMEGHASVAWVRLGEKSPFSIQEHRDVQESAYRFLLEELGQLGADVKKFKTKFKRLPKDWTELKSKKIRASLPNSPQAGFRLVKNGSGWVIQTVYKGTLNLQEVADPPTYDSARAIVEGTTHLRPPLNLIVALQCADTALARKALARLVEAKWLKALDADHWQTVFGEDMGKLQPWSLQFDSGCLVASDNPELLKRYVAPPAGEASLLTNEHYRTQRQQLPSSQGQEVLFGFFDIEDLLRTTSSFAELPAVAKVFTSVGAVQTCVLSHPSELPTSVYSEVFLELQPAGNLTLVDAPASPASPPVAAPASMPAESTDWSFVSHIPADSSLVYGLNVSELLKLLERAGQADAGAGMLWNGLYSQMQTAIGAPDVSQADLVRATGWLVAETELVDQIMAPLWEMRRAVASSGTESGAANLLSGLGRVPFSWSLEILDAALLDKLTKTLWASLGDKGALHSQGSWQYGCRGDGSWAMARLPQRLLGSSRYAKRLFLRDIDCAAGRRPALAELSTWQDFRGHVHGRPIFFSHQKCDWLYSIVKGFLLLFDSQARPEAEIFGRYRDTYAVATVEPKGVRAYAGFYSAGPEPTRPAAEPSKELVALHQQMESELRLRRGPDVKAGGVFVEARASGQLTACKSNLKNIAVALEMYSTDNSGHYPRNLALLTPNYLKVIPTCPAASKDTYSKHYRVGVKPDRYSVYCWGHAHKACSVPANRPAYNSDKGLLDK